MRRREGWRPRSRSAPAMRRIGAATCVVAALLTTAACTGGTESADDPDPTVEVDGQTALVVPATVPVPQPLSLSDAQVTAVAEALDAGGAYVEERVDDIDPVSLALYDYLWRNWQIEGLERAQEVAEAAPDSAFGDGSLARLVHVDRELPAEATASVSDPMTLALYCDRTPVASTFVNDLADLVRASEGPQLSTIAFAVVWFGELGCEAPDLTPIVDGLTTRASTELGALNEEPAEVNEPSLSLSATLVVLGRADLLSPAWVEAVVGAQREDGGWGQDSAASSSSPLTTSLALLTLAGASGPGEGAPMLRAAQG